MRATVMYAAGDVRIETGRRMGHELIGSVESVGSDVRTLKVGQLVLAPFLISDGTCEFCRAGFQPSCVHPRCAVRL